MILIFFFLGINAETGQKLSLTLMLQESALGTFRPIISPVTGRQITEHKLPFEGPDMFLPNSL
jgi:hypothetical protein